MDLHYKFEYSDAGNLISKIDGNNAKTEYNYDSVGRLNAVKHNAAKVAEFQHDANGNIISAENQNAEASFAYDEMNRLVSSTQTVGSVSAVVKNSYDANGNRTAWTLGDLTVQYNYGADNRLENVTTKNSNGTKSFSFGYDSANRLTTMNYPNGVNSSFSYDAENRVVSIQHGNFVNRQIERNPLGFKTEEKINAGISPKPPKNERRLKTYNAADQLVSEKIQTATTNWNNVSYAYNANGRLERITTEDTEDTEFSYDYNDLISSVTSASSAVKYLHDASGARIGRIENGVKTYFVIDYLDGLKRPLAEMDSSGKITRYYIWNGSQLLAHIESNGEVRYYHADELGSTLALTDKNGTVTDEFAYMPYGSATHTAHANSVKTPFQWLGGYGVYYDSETDLHLTPYRAYSSTQKRFISPDPLGIDGGVNVYAYANLNPLFFVDPEGLSGIPSIIAKAGAVITDILQIDDT